VADSKIASYRSYGSAGVWPRVASAALVAIVLRLSPPGCASKIGPLPGEVAEWLKALAC
jgi:hypothetical protein